MELGAHQSATAPGSSSPTTRPAWRARCRASNDDTDPLDYVYTRDLSREQPRSLVRFHSFAGRVTWQTSALNSKLGFYADQTPQYRAVMSATTSWDAFTPQETPRNEMYQATWTWTLNNRLLLDVGQGGTRRSS